VQRNQLGRQGSQPLVDLPYDGRHLGALLKATHANVLARCRLHALLGIRPGVFDTLLAPLLILRRLREPLNARHAWTPQGWRICQDRPGPRD
jgi:hypothetical protein